MEIRRATPRDRNAIEQIYKNAREFMKSCGNPAQWGDVYPYAYVIDEDIQENGCGYVVIYNNNIVGVFAFFENYDEEDYHQLDGKWLNTEPYAVIHRIASDNKTHGVAQFVFRWALEKSGNVRIDTHEKNIPMRKALDKFGFTQIGRFNITGHTFGDTARFAFQIIQ
jgi:RimJ/RimL family protein N-acetyltransferase